MSNPLFSIILPVFNRGHLISTAIESVLNQKIEDWELIVIDDGSTDNTSAVVQRFQQKDTRVKYLFQENAERSAARNNGIAQACGKYICFIDSDDYYLPDYLLVFKNFIQKNKAPRALLFCNLSFEYNGQIEPLTPPVFGNYTPVEFFLINSLGTPRVCLHQDITKDHLFDPSISISEDTELWIRISRYFPFFYLNEFTYVAVQHQGRSVNRLNTKSALKNLKAKKQILAQVSDAEVSQQIRKDILHDAWFGLAQSYFENRHFLGLVKASLKASVYQPFFRWKEKLYMIYVVLKSKLKISEE